VERITVVVRRGGVEEARHHVHAVAVEGSTVVAAAGDASLVTFFRSSAKPLQALPVVRARPDLDEAEIAIACASHLARPEQLSPVRSLLAKAPASEEELECGAEPTPLEHNCSGKHAAMLAEVAAAAEIEPASIPTGVDGCGVVTFALPLERMAVAFSRLEGLEGGDRVARAMRVHPDLIRGPSAADTVLMRALPGWIAKGGAEGLLCAASPDGLGLAVKVEDGATRAVRSASAAFLARLGVDGLATSVPLTNSRGEVVGETVTE